jgi:hypothetical protein
MCFAGMWWYDMHETGTTAMAWPLIYKHVWLALYICNKVPTATATAFTAVHENVHTMHSNVVQHKQVPLPQGLWHSTITDTKHNTMLAPCIPVSMLAAARASTLAGQCCPR